MHGFIGAINGYFAQINHWELATYFYGFIIAALVLYFLWDCVVSFICGGFLEVLEFIIGGIIMFPIYLIPGIIVTVLSIIGRWLFYF